MPVSPEPQENETPDLSDEEDALLDEAVARVNAELAESDEVPPNDPSPTSSS